MKEESPAFKRIWNWDLKGVLYPSPLKMKCLLCANKKLNVVNSECLKYSRKPGDICYRNASCPYFERCTDEEGLYWIEMYVWENEGYIPRDDDDPPEGWEEINIKHCGENWREITENWEKELRE